MAGWTSVLVSHAQLPDSGCRSSSLHQKQRHSIEGRRTSQHPTRPQDTSSRLRAPWYRHAVRPPCGSPGMPHGRTSTAAAQANAGMRRHPDCSEGRRRLVARSPHGHEQPARTTDATGRGPQAPRSYGRYLVALYNTERQHQSLGYRTPRQVYQEGLWICGRSALPTGCASPASRASSEGGEMLTFAHIPTGTTVNKAIDVDDSKSRGVAPATAPTMIGADIETGGATP